MNRSLWIPCGVLFAGTMLALAQLAAPAPQAQPTPMQATTAATSRATTGPLPSAVQVLEHYIAVTGGREAYASVTSRHIEADYLLADLGVTGKLVADVRADGNARQTITIPELDTFSEGITGDIAWSTSQTNGPRILEGAEAISLRQSLALNPELTLDNYASAEVTDIADVNGVPCYRMVLTQANAASTETRYYDVNSGYLVRRDNTVPNADGSISITTRFGDYEDAPPIRIAMKVRQSMSGLSPEQVVTRVVHNEPIPDARFELPAEVSELLKRRAASQPTPP